MITQIVETEAQTPVRISKRAEEYGRFFALAYSRRNPEQIRDLALRVIHEIENANRRPQNPLGLAVAELDLSLRIVNGLERLGVIYVRELLEMERCDIIAMPQFTDKVFVAIHVALEKAGVYDAIQKEKEKENENEESEETEET